MTTIDIEDVPRPVFTAGNKLLDLDAQAILRSVQALPTGQAKCVHPVSRKTIQALKNWIYRHGHEYQLNSKGDTIWVWRQSDAC